MRFAILADIHANLAALRAVLKDMAEQGCTHAVCLGDIVGYYFEPKECLDIIRGRQFPCVKGNHDEYCDPGIPLEGFNPRAAAFVEWTRQQLTQEDFVWLRNLKYFERVADFTIVHATLERPESWGYVFDRVAAAAHFPHQTTPVCFFGHTHVPVAFVRDTVVRGGVYSKFKVERERQYFINPGSVGQSRDGNPKAAYAIYDLEGQTIELRRVAFEAPPGKLGSAPAPTTPNPTKPIPDTDGF